ncbi:peptidoglycan-binding protein [Pseudocitrobacter faecalis]
MAATLWMFTNGSDVKKLQQLLNRNKFVPVLAEDGIFGKNTYNAVKIFQRYNGLNDDGIVGPQTWRKLGVPDHLTRSSPNSPVSPSSEPSRSPSIDSNGTVAETGEGFCFPFPVLPARSWTNGGRQFGASRSGAADMLAVIWYSPGNAYLCCC